jgi:hypothetical protein
VEDLRQIVAGDIESGRDLVDADRGFAPVGEEDDRTEGVFSGLG